MAIQEYLNFSGNCRELVEFYDEIIRTEKPQIMLFGDMPSNDDFPITKEHKIW